MTKFILKKPVARSWTWLFGKLLSMIERPRPVVFTGNNSIDLLCESARHLAVKKVLLITDDRLKSIGLISPIAENLKDQNISVEIFPEVLPDPSFSIVNKALLIARENGCDCVLAVGGGSVIDTAKVVSLALTNSSGTAEPLVGMFRAKKSAARLLVIPTTAGTGAEVTMAAVISDAKTHTKELIVDTKLIPTAVALDPQITSGAPAMLTATAGIDALSHAIEGYVSLWATPEVENLSEMVVSSIFENLKVACTEADNMRARENMILASHMAGVVINRSAAGYVHAISHQLGSLYKLPHGVINAAIMPDVLEFSKNSVKSKIARLSVKARLGDEYQSDDVLFDLFIEGLKNLNTSLGLNNSLRCVNPQDVNSIIDGAMLEANTTYAVPRYMNGQEMKRFLARYLDPSAG